MLELGDEAVETHREVGRYAGEIGVDFALAAGAADVTEIGMVRDNETAASYLGSILRPGDVVLVQASRRGQLWQIAQALTGQPITGLSAVARASLKADPYGRRLRGRLSDNGRPQSASAPASTSRYCSRPFIRCRTPQHRMTAYPHNRRAAVTGKPAVPSDLLKRPIYAEFI
ncbi:hypothetical protein ACFWVU_19730 [Streptomyces sp. NPDC058686]|uniref:hypothetical protein n=1 Tax=Streptomyces sp. NPDC058686 TaxID=3346599 RepID=UPI00366196F3